MQLAASRKIARIIENKRLGKIQSVLEPFSLEQRRFIVSKKMKQKSLLFKAVESKEIPLVKYLLDECGVSVKDAGSCLCMAASNKCLELVRILVNNGSDINELDSKGSSALYFACLNGDIAMVEYLVENDAKVNIADNVERITPLMVSVKYPNICRCLLTNGAEPNRVNTHGETALMMAVEQELFHYSAQLLFIFNADVDFTNSYGENAVFLASRGGFMQMVEFLQSYRADTTKALAISYQIGSCYAVLSNDRFKSQHYWGMYTQIRGLPPTTPMLQMDPLYTTKCSFETILDAGCQKVFLYLEKHFGLYHPYTLEALAASLWLTDGIQTCVSVFSLFLEILASCTDDLFFQILFYIDVVYTQLHLILTGNNACNSLETFLEILKLYVNHVEGIAARLERMNNIERSLISVNIDSVFNILTSLINTIWKISPGNMSALKESMEKVVSVDIRGSDNDTLLHFCVRTGYSMDICKALLSCKAEVNCRNRQHFTPVHYTVYNLQFQQMAIIQLFLSYGFVFDAWNDEEFCLACTLKERQILPQPVKNTTLQCLAASVVGKNEFLYGVEVPKHLQDFVSLHS